MFAQISEIKQFIKVHGGLDPDQLLSIEWAKTCSEDFRQEWADSSVKSSL